MAVALERALSWIVAHPSVSHALTASIEVIGLMLALHLFGLPEPEFIAAALVSTFYYGREAGQREHTLKHRGASPLRADLSAKFLFGWGQANVVQWVAPTFTVLAIALIVRGSSR